LADHRQKIGKIGKIVRPYLTSKVNDGPLIGVDLWAGSPQRHAPISAVVSVPL
jgi:hypothetical protein